MVAPAFAHEGTFSATTAKHLVIFFGGVSRKSAMQPTHVVLSEDGNDYKMILRVELWRNSPSWTLCMLPTGTEDEDGEDFVEQYG